MVQGLGDTHKEICIYAFALENLIDIGSLATDMSRQPGRRAFLPVHFLFDELSDVHKPWRANKIKRTESFVSYPL